MRTMFDKKVNLVIGIILMVIGIIGAIITIDYIIAEYDNPEEPPGLGYRYLLLAFGMIFFVILGGSILFYQIRMWKLD